MVRNETRRTFGRSRLRRQRGLTRWRQVLGDRSAEDSCGSQRPARPSRRSSSDMAREEGSMEVRGRRVGVVMARFRRRVRQFSPSWGGIAADPRTLEELHSREQEIPTRRRQDRRARQDQRRGRNELHAQQLPLQACDALQPRARSRQGRDRLREVVIAAVARQSSPASSGSQRFQALAVRRSCAVSA
jgi:hypothetical protein